MRFALLAVLVATSSFAVELNYTWKAGDVHRFSYADDTVISLAMMGMGGPPMRVSVSTTFAERVLAVRPDGSADVELLVEKLDVRQGGKSVAAIALLPPSSRVVRAVVDRKGHARFERMVTVYLEGERSFLVVSGQGGPGNASAQASADGTTLQVMASYDPKTGRMVATGSVTQTKTPTPVAAVQVKEDDPHVDVLPKQLFDLMVLPDGDLAPGSSVTISSMLGDLTVSLAPLQKAVAHLRVRLEGAQVNAGEAEANPDPDAANPMAMPTGMPSMPGFEGAPSTGASADGPAMGTKQDVDLTGNFDTAKGRLLGVDGALHQHLSVGGMGEVNVASAFKLSRL